jgi:hypothetical protein
MGERENKGSREMGIGKEISEVMSTGICRRDSIR